MQLGNHLGNVLVTISDRKKGVADPLNTALIKIFEPTMLSGTDYYPFGMAMRVRGESKYKYGFNGKENDNEVKGGEGLQQDYGMRVYDNRLGRFLSVDPITADYPELTPYQFASNRPIDGVDQDGLEWELNSASNYLTQKAVALKPVQANNGTIAPWDPSQRNWKQKWRDSKNILANITYDIANGLYTLPQQMTASIRNEDYITNIGGNVHRAHGLGGEKERTKNFVNGATTLLPGAPAAKAEGMIAKYTDNVITRLEEQITQQVTERGGLLKELADKGIKHSASEIAHIGKNSAGKVIFLEKGNAKAGLEHIMSHADEFVSIGIPKSQISNVVFNAATNGVKVGEQTATRIIYQTTYNGAKKI